MDKIKKLLLVVLLLIMGVLLTLAGLGLIGLPLATLMYFGVGSILIAVLYYFIY